MRTNIECNDGSPHQKNEGKSIYYSIDSHSCVGQRVNELSGGGEGGFRIMRIVSVLAQGRQLAETYVWFHCVYPAIQADKTFCHSGKIPSFPQFFLL